MTDYAREIEQIKTIRLLDDVREMARSLLAQVLEPWFGFAK